MFQKLNIFKWRVTEIVVMNNRCRYQSITQQYLKRCLIKNDSNYMLRPIAAIIRFSSESMVVVLYRTAQAAHPRIQYITDTFPPVSLNNSI